MAWITQRIPTRQKDWEELLFLSVWPPSTEHLLLFSEFRLRIFFVSVVLARYGWLRRNVLNAIRGHRAGRTPSQARWCLLVNVSRPSHVIVGQVHILSEMESRTTKTWVISVIREDVHEDLQLAYHFEATNFDQASNALWRVSIRSDVDCLSRYDEYVTAKSVPEQLGAPLGEPRKAERDLLRSGFSSSSSLFPSSPSILADVMHLTFN